MTNIKRFLEYVLLILLLLFFLFIAYFFGGSSTPAEKIVWGINFSQKHAQNLGLDWQDAYLSLIGDLGVKNLKIATYWNLLEPESGNYNFEDLDWQVKTAEDVGAKIFLVIGMKTPRWPECHIPGWASGLSRQGQQEKVLKLLEEIVLRYRDSYSIWAWQVENEPFFDFGKCPPADKKFLKKEIALVKSLDSKKRPVIISDSGEWSLWLKTAGLGDIIGTTIYRQVWSNELGFNIRYPFPPVFYNRRAQLIKKIFGKEVICVELQAEPWGKSLLYDSPLWEQERTMNLAEFQKNIEFAKKTGLKEFYLWGAEWWYWLKEKENKPEIWEEARMLFGR